MNSDGVYIYWIDKDFIIQSATVRPYHLKGSATYGSEAIHVTDCAEHVEVIPIERAEEPQYKQALERLKLKAKELQNNDESA